MRAPGPRPYELGLGQRARPAAHCGYRGGGLKELICKACRVTRSASALARGRLARELKSSGALSTSTHGPSGTFARDFDVAANWDELCKTCESHIGETADAPYRRGRYVRWRAV